MDTKEIILDARGKSLGRVASEAASYLRGKRSAAFLGHKAPTQKVIIKNAGEVKVSGRKLGQEYRERYSGYPGGLKKIPYGKTFEKSPQKFVRNAVSGMIPRTRLKKNILKNLTIYVGDQK